ncbi:MAG: vitamin K epoxide reductase family protein [Microbacteriaceae bacterium]
MPTSRTESRPVVLAISLIVLGVIGFCAAFLLTLDKFTLLENPNAQLSCSFSVLIGCAKNLGSWQGAILGFPNPLIGIACWPAVIAVGVAILAKARFSRWFWVLFNIGVTAALVFVVWLISESIFVLGVLCPWCMVTWAVTIPTFLAVTLYNLRSGNIPVPASVRRTAKTLSGWIPLLTLASYIIIVILAQVQLDALNHL